MYYKIYYSDLPSNIREKKGLFVDIAENTGHAITYTVLAFHTKKVFSLSTTRSTVDKSTPNLRLWLIDGEISKHEIIKSIPKKNNQEQPLFFISHVDIVRCTFLSHPLDNRKRNRAQIIKVTKEHEESKRLESEIRGLP